VRDGKKTSHATVPLTLRSITPKKNIQLRKLKMINSSKQVVHNVLFVKEQDNAKKYQIS